MQIGVRASIVAPMRLDDLPRLLAELRQASLLREPDDELSRLRMEKEFGKRFLDASSNDYLDLAGARWRDHGVLDHAVSASDGSLGSRETNVVAFKRLRDAETSGIVSRETLQEGRRPPVSRETSGSTVGARASRLVFGSHPEHLELERAVAHWLKRDSALLFSSGYAANVGALTALLSKEDAVFSDALNHASLIDGIRLSGAKPRIYAHLDLAELEEQLAQSGSAPARWIICESYYSMDGDGPDLLRLRELATKYDAQLYVDEAHSVGTFGPEGRGLCAAKGIDVDVLMVAFGKAVGAQGACVTGSESLRTWLWNRARSFVFSTAPSPLLARSVQAQVRSARLDEAGRERLAAGALDFRERLMAADVPLVQGSFGPIVSVIVGSAERALTCAALLQKEGILAQAIRPPTIAAGRSRLRLVLRASLNDDEIKRLARAVIHAYGLLQTP